MEEKNYELTKKILDTVRDIEGFPLGEDGDIIALSDPPYYTACPNPFIKDIIEKHGVPYEEENDDYQVEPYAADVAEGKNDPIYNAHTYHTKVPYKAIMRYILHYTKPGDIVLDGFCGTGMTGVAAQMCGKPDRDFKFQLEKEMPRVEWGARRAILNDLSPAATFIAYNLNTPVDVEEFKKEAERILEELERELGWMYETQHVLNDKVQYDITGKPIKGKINYTVWSDVFVCPNCAHELVFWDVAVDKKNKKMKNIFRCSKCDIKLKKTSMDRAMVTVYDEALDKNIKMAKQVPVLINYFVGRTRYNKKPDAYDLQLLERIDSIKAPYWFPTNALSKGDKTIEPLRLGITHVHQFYTKRNLMVISNFLDILHTLSKKQRNLIKCVMQSCLFHLSSLNRKVPGGIGRHLPGTIYLPSLSCEVSFFEMFNRKLADFNKASKYTMSFSKNSVITAQSSIDLGNLGSRTIDYIFTDPPFGSNLMYSELNFLWESWLKVFTNNKTEAIINKVQRKGLPEYQELMEKCFTEYFRVLKPGRWMTMVFHNSKNSVWNAIQEAILKVGFVIANIRTLDKQQGSFNQVNTATAIKQNLIISAYKPRDSFVKRFLSEAGTEEGAWNFIREYLKQQPVLVEKDDKLYIIPERQNYFLYDVMIAFHIQRGAFIPLDAADFYRGLEQRFVERDGMYFLPHQVNKYDQKRIRMEVAGQLSLFVTDEKSAIQWLYKELETPQKYQQIQPKFMQEMRRARHEKAMELMDLLKENFLQNENGEWYVPDLDKRSDLERLREKSLLKEFEEYRAGKGRLRVFRSEAIRAGFKKSWRERDYGTIVKVGKRLPVKVVQEDSSILMYYDNACTRLGE